MKKAWCLSNALDKDNKSPAMTALRTSENGSKLYRFNTLAFGIFPKKIKAQYKDVLHFLLLNTLFPLYVQLSSVGYKEHGTQ